MKVELAKKIYNLVSVFLKRNKTFVEIRFFHFFENNL